MAPDAVGVDELKDVGLLLSLLVRTVAAQQRRIVVLGPTERREMYLKVRENAVVKPVAADEELVNFRQEQPAFSALYNAMVVCARHGNDLADAEL